MRLIPQLPNLMISMLAVTSSMRFSWLPLLEMLILIVCWLFVPWRDSSAVAQVPYSVNDVIQKLGQFENTFLSNQSIYIEFKQLREYFPDESGKIPATKEPLRIIVARKGERLLTKAQVESGQQPPIWYTWTDNVGVTRVYDSLTIDAYPSPELGQYNHYSYCCFLDFYKGIQAVSQISKLMGKETLSEETRAFHLPYGIERDKDAWVVEPSMELVDTHKCVVISKNGGLDQVWLDPNCGFACRQRFWRDEEGKKTREWKNLALTKVAPALWLPQRQIHTFYYSSQVPSLEGTPRLREENQLVRASFEPLHDTFFDIPLPKENGIVTDFIRGTNYELHPHSMTNDELLTRSVVKARRILDASAPWQPGILPWTALFGLLGLGLYLRHRWRVR